MKFLCLCYYSAAEFAAMSASEMSAFVESCKVHDEALRTSGHLFAIGSLGMPEDAKTLRASRGSSVASLSHGPYEATPTPVGAFFIIEAKDRDEAAQVAALHPGAHAGKFLSGAIEVLPCGSFEQP